MTAGASIESPSLGAGGRELRVESLLGHRLRGADGESLGRIEEIVAEMRGTDWVVIEAHLGRRALVERLVELTTLVPIFGAPERRSGARYRVPWEQIDFSDPSRPRATVRRSDLERV